MAAGPACPRACPRCRPTSSCSSCSSSVPRASSPRSTRRRSEAVRNIFRTSYVQDIRLFEHAGHYFWYGLLLIGVFAAPMLIPQFFVGEMSLVFIYAVAGIGLMILTGYTGLASLGH